MKILDKIIYYLIVIYTFSMPIIPSTYHYKSINMTGDTLLFIIIMCFPLLLINKIIISKSFIFNYKTFFKDKINVFMFIWILTMFISIIYARDKSLAYQESLRILYYGILYLIIKYFISDKKSYINITKSYIYSCLVVGICGIYQGIMGIGNLKKSQFGIELRIESTMENSNNLGMFFVFAVFSFILLFINEKKFINKILYLILTIISLANIIMSGSRNALIGVAIGTVILILYYGVKYLIVLIIPIIMASTIHTLSSRLMDISDMSQNLSRIKLWKVALLIIKDHPILGVGNGNYPRYYPDYADKVSYINYTPIKNVHPHNAFLKAFSEMGILGLASFTGMIISSIILIYKYINNEDNQFLKLFYTGIFISMFPFVFMNTIDSFFSAPKVIIYYFITIGICEGIRLKSIL